MIQFPEDKREQLSKDLRVIAQDCPTFVEWLAFLTTTMPLMDELPHKVAYNAGKRDAHLDLLSRLEMEMRNG